MYQKAQSQKIERFLTESQIKRNGLTPDMLIFVSPYASDKTSEHDIYEADGVSKIGKTLKFNKSGNAIVKGQKEKPSINY